MSSRFLFIFGLQSHVLKDLYILIILLEVLFSHQYGRHEFSVSFCLVVAFDITLEEFAQLRAIKASAI